MGLGAALPSPYGRPRLPGQPLPFAELHAGADEYEVFGEGSEEEEEEGGGYQSEEAGRGYQSEGLGGVSDEEEEG